MTLTETGTSIGQRIKHVRKLHKLSQDSVASHTGIGRSSVNSIERGDQRPPVDFLIKFCELTGITSDSILFEDSIAPAQVSNDHLEALINEANPDRRQLLVEAVQKEFQEMKRAIDEVNSENTKLQSELETLRDEMLNIANQLRQVFEPKN